MSYFSFLVCDHGPIKNIYFNGRQLGTIQDGVFRPEMKPAADGQVRPVGVHDLIDPNPFRSVQELRAHLIEIINKLELVSPPPAPSTGTVAGRRS